MRGRPPKDDDQKINHNALVHSWVDVTNVPYDGPRPKTGRLGAASAAWWEAVSTMPHCILWTASDWQFALDTLQLHRAFSKRDGSGLGKAGELRIREHTMGTTAAARRDLRVRYLEPWGNTAAPEAVTPEGMNPEDEERWRRLVNADA